MSLKNKVAVVTGAAAGIGFETVKTFLREGVKGIACLDLSVDALTVAVSSFDVEDQSKLLALPANVANEKEVSEALRQAKERFSRIDIAVLNAGVSQTRCAVGELSIEEFDRVMNVNLRGCFLCLKYSIQAIQSSPEPPNGSIVLVGSQLGLDGMSQSTENALQLLNTKKGQPYASAYAASKFAVRGLTLSAAAEYGEQGIRINTVCPGPTSTNMLDKYSSTALDTMAAKTMLNRLGKADEIAQAILFLSSDASSFVTGTTLKADGGYSKFG